MEHVERLLAAKQDFLVPCVYHFYQCPPVLVRGEGAYLYDREGRSYLDFLSGYSVYNIGRNHPVLRDALKAVLGSDLPNLIQMDVSVLSGVLAERLLSYTPWLQKVLRCHAVSASIDFSLPVPVQMEVYLLRLAQWAVDHVLHYAAVQRAIAALAAGPLRGAILRTYAASADHMRRLTSVRANAKFADSSASRFTFKQ